MPHALNVVIDWFARTFENSFSWRSLQLRMAALRTGEPFAEILLRDGLAYRVEQVFLIQPGSGVLMQHVAAPGLDVGQAADLVSAMLTAIRDFVEDSFRADSAEGLETLRVGNLAVSIHPGPYAFLAIIVRGAMPGQLRQSFQTTLETIHLRYLNQLKSFAGDPDLLAATRPLLESCLLARFSPEHTSRQRQR